MLFSIDVHRLSLFVVSHFDEVKQMQGDLLIFEVVLFVYSKDLLWPKPLNTMRFGAARRWQQLSWNHITPCFLEAHDH